MSVITSPRGGGPQAPPPRGDSPAPGGLVPPSLPPLGPEKPRRRWGWWRMFLGAVIVLLFAAGGSAVFVLEQVHSIKVALSQNKSLNIAPGELASAGSGSPETLLLVGDDTRRGFKYYRGYVPDLANEMLLVRLDPSKPYISMMSIPRELMATIYNNNGQAVDVQGLPQNRLNSALTYGPGALLTTIQRDLGLSVNHVVITTFHNFEQAVNKMGCVYSTVDQRYYNLNLGTPGTNYQSINLQPGYQKMCGPEAEEFVSFRHTDTSLVRDARDQSFLLDVKKQYGPTLVDNVSKFERIFGQAVYTDQGLKSSGEIINLLGTLIDLANKPVRQVHFQVNLQPTGANPCSCDTATQQQISNSIDSFLYGGSSIPKRSVAAAQAQAVHTKQGAAQLPLVPVPSSAQAEARAVALKLAFPLEYPDVEDRAGSVQSPYLRSYLIEAPGGTEYPVYVGVFYGGQLGAYYDVQGMTWTTAPQFDSPDQTVQVGPRTYYLYYDGSNLRMVAWHEHGAVYWVRNSLANTLPNGEMLAIAEQTRPFAGIHATSTQPRVINLKDASVPRRIVHTTPLTLREKVGGITAVITLLALPLLAFVAIRRIVDVRRTRRGVRTGELRPTAAFLGARPAFGGAGAAGSALSPLVGTRRSASGRWVGTPTVYRRSRLRRPAVIVPIVLLLLAAAGAGTYLLVRHHARTTPVHRVKRVTPPAIPTTPVVVLNSTSTPGAAHKLAVYLQARRVKVTGVGNLTQTLPPGNEILYAPGELAQAELLDHMLTGQVATVAPIDPVVQGAAPKGTQLVVVIT